MSQDPVGPSRGSQLLIEWQGQSMTSRAAAKLLAIDEVTYSRFRNGIRHPSGEIGVRIERLTNGKVPSGSWYDPPVDERRPPKSAPASTKQRRSRAS